MNSQVSDDFDFTNDPVYDLLAAIVKQAHRDSYSLKARQWIKKVQQQVFETGTGAEAIMAVILEGPRQGRLL